MRVEDDFDAVYNRDEVVVGWPEGIRSIPARLGRPNSTAVIGMCWGDEGKGRIVDNILEETLKIPGVKLAYVVRFQGGSNAGHTVYRDGKKVPLYQIPSGIMFPEAVGIMDQGMIIHMEDLQTEIEDAERIVGDLRGKLVLSEDAMLCTDLERAEEVFNRQKTSGKSSGGTGRGIAPTVAHYMDRQGNLVCDLMGESWEDVFAAKYDRYEKDFGTWGFSLADMDVPDLRATRDQKGPISRKIGSKQDFIDRMRSVRTWYLEREASVPDGQQMIQNTFPLHHEIDSKLQSRTAGFLAEGSRAVGLHPRLGRAPDITTTDTTLNGIKPGTGYWTSQMLGPAYGVFKITYDGSVGAGKPITHIPLPKNVDVLADVKAQMQDEWKTWGPQEYWTAIDALEGLSPEQKHAAWIQYVANEKGTTTGRYRDICYLDLAMLRFNAKVGGVSMLAGTHLDIARAGEPIRVCTHYTDEYGNNVPYQPGIKRQEGLTPQYIDLPGFDGEEVARAQDFIQLPDNAQRFLAFVQRQLGLPITFVTTGPERHNALHVPKVRDKNQYFAR